MGHGDEGRLYNHAGQTALGLATRTGKNVVCGHTHRQGISSASRTDLLEIKQHFGVWKLGTCATLIVLVCVI
jgi:UDP-2,3-diacylglucosamine pyrophosphatase LpxH